MDDDPTDPHEDAALRAFRQMQDEARERHAELMEKLAAAPDYAPTLAVIGKSVDWLVERTNNALTVDDVMAQVAETTAEIIQQDRETLAEARSAMLDSRKAMDASRETHIRETQRVRSVRDQTIQNRRWLAAGVAAGAVAMMVLPGMLARAAPSGWQLPERLAARMLRLSMGDAGMHMLVVANPRAATEIVEGARLMWENREVIAKCRAGGRKAGAVVICRINLST